MLAHLRRGVILVVIALVLTFAYAFLGTGVSQLFFRHQADGSLTANGSTLIGQNWSLTKCPGHPLGSCVFQGRPDDLGPYAGKPTSKPPVAGGDNPLEACSSPSPSSCVSGESAATNLGPRSKVLLANTKALVAYWRARGVDPTPDLVTTSGSSYDPDITPQDALVQIPMVSDATGISPSALRALISRETNGEELGFLGSRYIDVLQLNEALAKLR
ncbi:MAG TPA: potassium-transporting ATPase subunit C [Acidimicrobiales bacterium]|nr:potassium-transporting ATPase subunit C [Acidimicrobiales bacterium]